MTRTSLRNVKLDEISLVGKGDNKGAHVVLLKTHPNPIITLGKAYRGNELETTIRKWAADNVGKKTEVATGIFKDLSDIVDGVTDIEASAEMFNDVMLENIQREIVWDAIWALETSIASIINDDTGSNKPALVATTVDQFKTTITALFKLKGETSMAMSDVEKAQYDEAIVKVATLTTQLETVTKEKEELAKQIPTATSVIKMEDLPEPVRKQMEAQEAELKKNREDIAKMQEDGINAECIAKAAEISAVSAEGVVVHDVLKSIKKHSADLFDKVFTILKAADARIKEAGLFKEVGGGQQSTGATAYEQIVVKATELRKTCPELSDAQAFDRIFKSDANLRAQYNAENRTK